MGEIIHDFVRYNERVQHDFSARLNEGLTAAQRQLIARVAQESNARGLPLYAVGGLPRDLWLGSKATDLDLVVEGDAIALARALAARYGGKVTVHPKFGTAKWDLRGTGFEAGSESPEAAGHDHAGHFLDLVSARSETYRHPAALPTVKRGTIEDDIRRRDFTVNTLALRLDGQHFGELRDEFGALADLKNGSIRVLHARSFIDDPTRMYRASRYEQRFGFQMDGETLALVPNARALVAELSGQRIRHELDLILEEGGAAAILSRLAKLNLLQAVHPALPATQSAQARVRLAGHLPGSPTRSWSRRDVAWLLWLMDLHEPEIRSLGKRLHFTGPGLRDLRAAAKLHASAASLSRGQPSRVTSRLDQYPELAVYAVSLASSGKRRRTLDEYLAKWRHIRPVTTGHDLKALGLPPGPAYRKILDRLRADWIDGFIEDAGDERNRLHDLLQHAPRKVVTKAQSHRH
jgi:tRNA nucleotidyltransferase (CCA-adding enzyme)